MRGTLLLALPLLLCLAAALPRFQQIGVAELPAPPLDLAWIGQDRLLALLPDSLLLLARTDDAWAAVDRLGLPPPSQPIRQPGGLLAVSAGEQSAWLLVCGQPAALLVGVERGRLSLLGQGETLPWPGAPGGLRCLAGTSLFEGEVERLGAGPHLRLAAGAAVGPDGTFRVPDVTEAPAVGGALASLTPESWVASSDRPPGERDEIALLQRRGPAVHRVESLAVDGAVRALAARAEAGRALLAAGLGVSGGARLLVLEVDLP